MKFDPDKDIPDLSGKVILVTGGNIGLGRETVHQLSKHNPAHIFLAARNKSKAETTISELKQSVPNGAPISFLELDLSSFDSIKQAVSTFNAKSDRLDLLFNNAGIMACPAGQTAEGYEIQFGTNHVGHALLTELLLPKLKETASKPRPTSPDAKSDVRIINLSSAAHGWAPPLPSLYNWDHVKTPTSGLSSTWARYGQSKLANIHYNTHLARQNPEITCVAIHPGTVGTNLVSGPAASYPYLAGVIRFFTKFVTLSVADGAKNQLWAATAKVGDGGLRSGVFYCPVAVEGKENALARDEKLARDLWEWTERELEGHDRQTPPSETVGLYNHVVIDENKL